MRNILFFKTSYAKSGVEANPWPFLINQNWAYLWSTSLKVIKFIFTVCPSYGLPKYINTKVLTTYFNLIWSFFKNKFRSGTSTTASFCAWFLKEKISHVIFYKLSKFSCLIAFNSWDIAQYVHYDYLLSRLWRHNFLN